MKWFVAKIVSRYSRRSGIPDLEWLGSFPDYEVANEFAMWLESRLDPVSRARVRYLISFDPEYYYDD